MNQKQYIEFCDRKNRCYKIPNAWSLLNQQEYIFLCSLLRQFAIGKMSAGLVKSLFVCKIMSWNPQKIKSSLSLCNLAALADQVTFIFNINYPDSVLSVLSEKEKIYFKKVAPDHSDLTIARYLATQNYTFSVDSVFCAQLLPVLEIGRRKFNGYTINTNMGGFTTSLRAQQYIDACELVNAEEKTLPILASILYFEGQYSSIAAHERAGIFKNLPAEILEAIALNFIAFNNFILKSPAYKILSEGKKTEKNVMALGPTESLYNLAGDGYGDLASVQQMNLLEYFDLNKKKTIDAVRSMNEANIKILDIVSKTGLSLSTIENIIK